MCRGPYLTATVDRRADRVRLRAHRGRDAGDTSPTADRRDFRGFPSRTRADAREVRRRVRWSGHEPPRHSLPVRRRGCGDGSTPDARRGRSPVPAAFRRVVGGERVPATRMTDRLPHLTVRVLPKGAAIPTANRSIHLADAVMVDVTADASGELIAVTHSDSTLSRLTTAAVTVVTAIPATLQCELRRSGPVRRTVRQPRVDTSRTPVGAFARPVRAGVGRPRNHHARFVWAAVGSATPARRPATRCEDEDSPHSGGGATPPPLCPGLSVKWECLLLPTPSHRRSAAHRHVSSDAWMSGDADRTAVATSHVL